MVSHIVNLPDSVASSLRNPATNYGICRRQFSALFRVSDGLWCHADEFCSFGNPPATSDGTRFRTVIAKLRLCDHLCHCVTTGDQLV
ncbi:hypothetical protein NGUA32_04124 [Salmonella enterica]|nr:hypothetical protein NGUA32_04124 [Salmonella enterica]